tara:strand:+ start:515 stop:1225 length:711 start_codon:yes stop_codon:yes gene_type:complete
MIEVIISFAAGIISFLSPCVLPLIPGYISYISGQSLSEILENKKINYIGMILFCLGFSFIFILFGVTASFLGKLLLQNSTILRVIAGVIIVIFSLQLLGIINIKILNYEKKYYTSKKYLNFFFPFIIGVAFAFGWTPCIGPILGSILAIASTEENLYRAIILLTAYSLGLAIPFVLSGYLVQKFLIFSKKIKNYINIIFKSGGIILLITGILIITNQFQIIGYYILETIPFLQSFG